LCEQLQPDLIIVGPEAILAAGVTDALQEAGFAVFGPTQQAARLESSKAFAKEIMQAAGVPTGQAHTVTDREQLEWALESFGAPYVVNDDGLAACNGVTVTSDHNGAIAHGAAIIACDAPVLVEEYFVDFDVSVFANGDGIPRVAMSPAHDFKRVLDNDQGP